MGAYDNSDSDGDFNVGIELNPRPLFGLYRLAQHDKNQAVFIIEGEKCAAALQSLGLCAVTSLGGCNAAKQADWTPLNDFKTVFYYPTMTKQANTTHKTFIKHQPL